MSFIAIIYYMVWKKNLFKLLLVQFFFNFGNQVLSRSNISVNSNILSIKQRIAKGGKKSYYWQF